MKLPRLVRHASVAAIAAVLAGCGLAETGAAAATQGESAAEQARQAKEITQGVESDVAAAQAAGRDAIDAADE